MKKLIQQMTQRTFEEGIPWPPLKADTLRLYSMRFCPYAQRARLVLAHKHIQYETINVHLKRKPSWLFDRNPKGRVPVLEHPDGRIVFESLVMCQYLDDIFPQGRLTPTDPYLKARDQLLLPCCDQLMMAIYQMLFTNGTSEQARATFLKCFRIFESELNKRLPDGPFFGGDRPVLVDYMIWPWFERLPMLNDSIPDTTVTFPTTSNSIQHDPPGVRDGQFPGLHQWMTAMLTLPAVQETMFDVETHRRFGRSQLTADPEYDMGLEHEPPLPSSARL